MYSSMDTQEPQRTRHRLTRPALTQPGRPMYTRWNRRLSSLSHWLHTAPEIYRVTHQRRIHLCLQVTRKLISLSAIAINVTLMWSVRLSICLCICHQRKMLKSWEKMRCHLAETCVWPQSKSPLRWRLRSPNEKMCEKVWVKTAVKTCMHVVGEPTCKSLAFNIFFFSQYVNFSGTPFIKVAIRNAVGTTAVINFVSYSHVVYCFHLFTWISSPSSIYSKQASTQEKNKIRNRHFF